MFLSYCLYQHSIPEALTHWCGLGFFHSKLLFGIPSRLPDWSVWIVPGFGCWHIHQQSSPQGFLENGNAEESDLAGDFSIFFHGKLSETVGR
jgi:hypothetical protein